MKIDVHIPVRTVSVLNSRVHWSERHKLSRQQIETTRLLLQSAMNGLPDCGRSIRKATTITVRFTRYFNGARKLGRPATRKLDSGDNLQASFKSIRDALAMVAGIDDGEKVYDWKYDQEKSDKYGVRVEMEWK